MPAFRIVDHWLQGAHRIHSPNHSERGAGAGISLLVIHNISLPPGQFGGPWISDLFCNQLSPDYHPYFAGICQLRVSAHLLIRRDGEVLQYVPFDRKAWHAGKSVFEGREECNEFSIGIELEGADDVAFTDFQYERLQLITRLLLEQYPALTPQRIAGHSDIAPGRKTDPGPCFDWARYRAGL
ncbi:MAG TPA: 1,6-anhydro-N-acetylmuramyl-L-alanine amidase AmpD [Candidatus Acidoferrum sp.]|nr:1,6-anhydro-N-acetylmuramyl-L-alanine amidase AmpD [Candidatus Acidoferrum sp.]